MPYTMSEPPDKIKGLPKHAKEIWIAAFNSALEQYKDEGKATATAWKAVENGGYSQDKDGKWHAKKSNAIVDLWNEIKRLFEPLIEERAVSTSAMYEQVCMSLRNIGEPEGEHARLIDIYHDDGKIYAVCAMGGKLYRADLIVGEGGAEIVPLDQWLQVTETFPVVVGAPFENEEGTEETRRSIHIVRQADGRIRWLAAACTAYLNRVGEIDSRELFDNFVKRGKMPYLTFYHQGEALKMGGADYLARDGNTLIASGLFDDTPLALASAEGLERGGDFWGTSIKYLPLMFPVKLSVAGVEIDTYNDGELEEISVLPERRAAALFTSIGKEDGMNKTVKDALTMLVGQALADEFEQRVDATNKRGTEEGLISREDATATQPVAETPVEQPEASAPPAPEPTKEPEPTQREIVLDDEAMTVLAQKVFESDTFRALGTQMEAILDKITQLGAEATRASEFANVRLTKLERDEEEKKREWLEDVPAKSTISVTYKPREAHEVVNEGNDPTARAEAIRARAGIKK